jgi:hypothetical protein
MLPGHYTLDAEDNSISKKSVMGLLTGKAIGFRRQGKASRIENIKVSADGADR